MAASSVQDFYRPCPKNGYYDVFLSFRGIDTRYGFTANLYRLLRENNVYTFMDIKLTGEDIDYLFEMVRKSRMAVVIYSESFASSDWCLRELDMILQLRKEKKILMIPVFYKVDLHDLKHLTGKTAKYLNKHVEKHGETSVQKWRDAVTSLGNVSGLSYKDTHGRYEYDFITEVITRIKEKLEECEEVQDMRNQDNKMECPIVEVEVQFTSSAFEDSWFKRMTYMDKSVSSIDVHRTKPWVLLSLFSGSVSIWDYNTRAEEKSIKVASSPVIYAKFIPEKHWIVVKGLYGFVYLLDYNTSKKLKEFKFRNNIFYMEVHPTLPYVLTSSSDKHIKLWNWENNWACSETFKGHSQPVVQVAFNPKDPNSFASVSIDGIIKLWSLGSSVAKFTIGAHAKGFKCQYFVGNDDKLYLLTSSDDFSVKIWDYESKTIVQTLEGHTDFITAIFVHPELPIILTGSTDIHIWNKNTHELLLVWKSIHGPIKSFGFIKATGEVVIGCKNGMVVIKLFFGRD